jgi:hypothetical protein
MGNLADHLTGGVTCKLLILDPLQELRASQSPAGVSLKVIRQDVGIHEHGVAGGQAGKGHGSSVGGG